MPDGYLTSGPSSVSSIRCPVRWTRCKIRSRLSGNVVRAPGSNVGDYAITKGTRTAGPNYDLTVTPGTTR